MYRRKIKQADMKHITDHVHGPEKPTQPTNFCKDYTLYLRARHKRIYGAKRCLLMVKTIVATLFAACTVSPGRGVSLSSFYQFGHLRSFRAPAHSFLN